MNKHLRILSFFLSVNFQSQTRCNNNSKKNKQGKPTECRQLEIPQTDKTKRDYFNFDCVNTELKKIFNQ